MADYLEMLRGLLSAFGPREAEAKMLPMDDRASRMIKLQREAQAPAPGSPEAAAPLTGRWFSPERRALYQDIGRATEAHPKTLEVFAPRNWPKEHRQYGGVYHPEVDQMSIAPSRYQTDTGLGEEVALNLPLESRAPGKKVPMPPEALPIQDTLAHEQLHFLMSKLLEAEKGERTSRVQGMSLAEMAEAVQRGGIGAPGIAHAFSTNDLQHQLIAYLLGMEGTPGVIRKTTYAEPMTGTHPPASSPEIADAYRRLIYQIFPDEARRARALAGLGAPRGGTLLEEVR